ncbi:MAG: WecB/TagA/CpsF family glycosyltransferase, partial [Clostridiales bacterium]|nr:WecB/TagA/CpsF family glycosyltransferase [Clostridiales bacterium]
KWINRNKDRLNCRLAMGVGGSVDIYAGVAKRAPTVFQKLGLEWFYRLLKEPWRFKRMLVLPKFLAKFIFTK